jgi:hypothetical protein
MANMHVTSSAYLPKDIEEVPGLDHRPDPRQMERRAAIRPRASSQPPFAGSSAPRLVPDPVLPEEDEGPDHDVLAAGRIQRRGRVDAGVRNDQRETEPSVTEP